MSKLPFIIAVDFDGTLVSDQFPEIGEPNKVLIEVCKIWQSGGAKLILWTCRDGQRLLDAIAFCESHGLTFDAANRNIEEVQEMYGCDTRKVFADVYIDDKAITPETYVESISRRLGDAIRNNNNK